MASITEITAAAMPGGVYLVPGDENFLHLMRTTGEVVLDQVCGYDPGSESEPFTLPPGVVDPTLAAAWGQLQTAIAAALDEAGPRRLMIGQRECVPMALVEANAPAMARLRGVEQVLRAATHDDPYASEPAPERGADLLELAELLDQLAAWYALELGTVTDLPTEGARIAELLTRTLRVLDLGADPEARPLVLRLAAETGTGSIHLNAAEHEAYRYLAARYSTALAPHDAALHRWAY